MFRRPTVRYGKTPEPETPYQRAGQVWDERIGSARVQAKNWRLAFFGALALSGGLAGGLVWQSARGTITPWVVQVDKLGQAQAVAPGGRRLSADRSADRLASRSLHRGGAQHSRRSGRAAAGLARRLQLRHRQGRAGAQRLRAHQRPLLQGRQDADRRSKSRASSAPPTTASASPGPSGATSTTRSPPPNAGAPSSPSSCRRRPTPIG